jgi:hypothetical protein
LGAHTDPNDKKRLPEIAGGYIQFASSKYLLTPPKAYYGHAKFIRRHMKSVVGKRVWRIAFRLTPCAYQFKGPTEFGGSNYLAFWAFEKTIASAKNAREELIEELALAMFHPLALKKLATSYAENWDAADQMNDVLG